MEHFVPHRTRFNCREWYTHRLIAQETPALSGIQTLVHENIDVEQWLDELIALIPVTPLNNLTGTPAISLPLCEEPNGMPLGAQFMAPTGREDRLLSLAGQLRRASPWLHRHPQIHVCH